MKLPLATYYFVHPIFGYDSYSPESSSQRMDGNGCVTFEMDIGVALVTVSVPWSNIKAKVEEQHWK